MVGLLQTVDQFSLLRSIVIGKVKADIAHFYLKWKGTKDIPQKDLNSLKELRKINHKLVTDRSNSQMTAVRILIEQLEIPLKDTYDRDDLKQIQRQFNSFYGKYKYRIHLFTVSGEIGCQHEWSGASPSERNIIIIRRGMNFDIARNIGKIRKYEYFCNDCLQTSRYSYRHRCDYSCKNCGISVLICNVSDQSYRKQCSECGVYFLSEQCYVRHKKKSNRGSVRCEIIRYCDQCSKYFNVKNFARGEFHTCGFSSFCVICGRHVEPNKQHPCYTRLPTDYQKKKWREREQQLSIICFDLECQQSIEREDETFDYIRNHEAVMAIARKSCINCFDGTLSDVDSPCERCGLKEHIVSYSNSDNVISDFVDWLFQPKHNNSYLIAHYGGRYDHLILVSEFIRKGIIPEVLFRGRRLITGTVTHQGCTLHIRDSFNLIPLSLGKFDKAFNLTGAKKGYFPYYLIEKKWYHTRQSYLPALRYYNTGSLTKDALKNFLEWYNAHNVEENIFDFDEEILAYCRSDVQILIRGILEYRRTMINLTTWDPILSPTLPSFTSHVLRCDHFPPMTLTNTPDAGYRFNRQQSDMAVKWLKLRMRETGEFIQHAENGGERRVTVPGLTTFVDGYCERKEDKHIVILEYSGCFHHGHTCFNPLEMNKLHKQTFGVLYAATMSRLEKLRAVYEVEHIWECEFLRELRVNKEKREFVNSCYSSRLNLRLAMQGGRCDSHVTNAKSDEKNKIVFYDYISLYPKIMLDCELPVGPPIVKRNGFPPVPSTSFPFKGLAHLRILPPTDLRHPLLAVKMHNSLIFPVCRTCSQKKLKTKCTHSDEERSITGTWVHFEIIKALSLNYVILEYYEIWIYDKWSTTLFAKYIKTFYKVKTASSGWPKGVKSDEDKAKCLAHYKKTMGFDLTVDEVKECNARKYLSKLLLNTSWGKLSQRIVLKKTIFCDGDGLCHLMDAKLHLISTYRQLRDDLFIVSVGLPPEEAHSSPNGNLPIGITITAHGRLLLYSLLERAYPNACYNDTDSILAVVPRNSNPFIDLIGISIGELNDETSGKLIVRAVFGGPKAYALKLVDEETGEISYVVKIRGISLDSDASEIINFKSLKRLILNKEGQGELITKRTNLKRTVLGVTTVTEIKKYKTVCDKGYIVKGHVYPHGYCPDTL